MTMLSLQTFVLFIGFSLFPCHECRWIFLDSHGHRIRHNRYWKISYNEEEEPIDCPPVKTALNFTLCPKRKCSSDDDCLTKDHQGFRCYCDTSLCGQVCLPINAKCAQPRLLLNGVVKITFNNQPGAEIFYRCNDGFRLVGESKRTCQANNLWSGQAPECIRGTFCGAPPVVTMADNDAESSRDKFLPGMTLIYRCRKGHTNIGQNHMSICGDNGLWIGPHMRCEPIRCSFPRIRNGQILHSGTTYNRTIVISCNTGYKLKCSNKRNCKFRTCLMNGTWSGGEPVCERLQCLDIPHPPNGVVSIVSTPVYTRATFSCRPGYYLEGSRKRHCQNNGRWSGTNASCRIIKCDLPPYVSQARVNYTSTIYGSTATYRCLTENGLSIKSTTLRCGRDGKWIPKPINCVKTCNSSEIDEKKINEHMKSMTTANCRTGYLQRRPVYPVCVNGSWSYSNQCQPAPCLNKLPMGANSEAFYYTLEHGSVARFECTLGYRRASGSNSLRCDHGTWVGEPPTCKRSTCSRPPVPKNGFTFLVGIQGRWRYSIPTIRVQHQDVIEYECKSGYVLTGVRKSTCYYGEWRPDTTPLCIRDRRRSKPLDDI